MKKVLAIILSLLLIFTLAGCGKYTSSYSALALVHSNDSDSALLNFYTLNGRMVFKLNCPDEGTLKYKAKLESGSVNVYYDITGTKEELFTLSDGEEVESQLEDIGSGKLYIIVETDGKATNGDFHFSVE